MAFPVTAPRFASRHYRLSLTLATWLTTSPRGRYDVIHADSPWSGASAVACVYTALSRQVFVITPHEVFTPYDLKQGRSGIRAAKLMASRLYGRGADTIVCSSPLEMRDVRAAGLPGSRLTWIYHPVVDDRMAPAPPQRSPGSSPGFRVGYLGRIHPKKNVGLLVDAVGRLGGRATLVVAGRGDLRLDEALRRRADRVLPGGVEFIGWVDAADKAEFLANIDVLAMPSAYECFGVAAIEALAAGTPVIVSDRVGVADIIRERRAGRVVPPTVDSLADAILGYLNDPLSLAADAARARGAALADASYAAHGVQLASLYAGLLAAQR